MVVTKESKAIVDNFKSAVNQFKNAYKQLLETWENLNCIGDGKPLHDSLVESQTDKIVGGLTDPGNYPFFVASFDELGIAEWCDDVCAALQPHEVNFERAFVLLGDTVIARQLLQLKAERKEDGSVDGMEEDMVDFFRMVFPRADARLNNSDLVDGKPPKDWTKSDEKALETLFAMAKTALGNPKE